MNAIRTETKKLLKTSRGMTPELEYLALKLLKESSVSGRKIFEVRYPEVFMNIDPSIPPSQRSTLGLAVAAYFLKRVSFK